MLEESRFLEILKKHGAEITGAQGVFIAGEEKSLEELHELIDTHFYKSASVRIPYRQRLRDSYKLEENITEPNATEATEDQANLLSFAC